MRNNNRHKRRAYNIFHAKCEKCINAKSWEYNTKRSDAAARRFWRVKLPRQKRSPLATHSRFNCVKFITLKPSINAFIFYSQDAANTGRIDSESNGVATHLVRKSVLTLHFIATFVKYKFSARTLINYCLTRIS